MTDFNDRKSEFLRALDTARKSATPADGQSKSKRKYAWFKDTCSIIERYLQQVHLINLPQDFRTQLLLAHNEHHVYGTDFNIPFRTIDALVKSCDMWRDYLADQQDFDRLVCLETCSMVSIHASVISARNFYEKQGAKNVHLKGDACPPYLFTTVVTHDGSLKVFGNR